MIIIVVWPLSSNFSKFCSFHPPCMVGS